MCALWIPKGASGNGKNRTLAHMNFRKCGKVIVKGIPQSVNPEFTSSTSLIRQYGIYVLMNSFFNIPIP
jgi:hypothetical protein